MNQSHNPVSADEYALQLQNYIQSVANLNIGVRLEDRRLEHQFECLQDWSLLHTEAYVRDWFLTMRDNCPMLVQEIPLNQVRNWHRDPESGDISHQSGEFFRIHGIRVTHTVDREVGEGGWDQPIFTQVGYEGGILGIVSQRFDGIPHYLIEAKAEPGNYKKLQLSPTLQATFSNLKQAHAGRKPRFSSFFEEPEQNGAKVLHKQWLSEDGGRLYLKRNMGMIVEVPDEIELDIPDSFIWVSMYQIKSLLQENAWINPHIRGIIAHL